MSISRSILFIAAVLPLSAAPVTYNHDIAPILTRSCAPCHRPGESGPFPLLSYEDAQKRAAQIAAVTKRRYMPPWLPEHGYGDFEDELRLTDAQIQAIAEWVAQGAVRGEGEPAVAPPAESLGKADLTVEAEHPYTVPASGADVYWNFVFRPAIDKAQFVRAVEIDPGGGTREALRVVHHANLLVDRAGSQSIAGFPGMDLAIMRSPFDPDGNFLFWKPGAPTHVEPDGFAWRIDPGNELVLNVHMHPSGKEQQVRPKVSLYFTDRPQRRFPLLVQLENDNALNIPAGAPNFVVSDDFRLPLDVEVLAIYPHAHYLGKLLEAYATLPDGKRKWLIRIPDWDPNWQSVYYYRATILLPKGSVISLRYHYDNSAANVRNPNRPARRVEGGNQATDEMAHLWLEMLPRNPGDHRRELQEAVMQHRLERNPKDAVARMNLGAILLSRLRPQDAVGMLQSAVELDPGRAEARNMLGLALSQTGRVREAAEQFARAVAANPEFFSARVNLAAVEWKLGALDDAIANLKILAAAQPQNETIRKRLEEATQARGGK
jgi:Tfp pilus assembly protein PilF